MPDLNEAVFEELPAKQLGSYTTGGVGGAVYPINVDNARYTSYYKRREGHLSPDWPRVKTQNFYRANFIRRRSSPFDYEGNNPTSGDHSEQTIHPALINGLAQQTFRDVEIGTIEALVIDEVLRRMETKLKDLKVNVGQAIAEMQQTVNLVVSSARRIAGSITALKRGNIPKAIHELVGTSPRKRGFGLANNTINSRHVARAGGIPEQWLALQYGWKPLLSDIYGSASALADLLTERPMVYSAEASYKRKLDAYTNRIGAAGTFPAQKWQREKGYVAGRGRINVTVGSEFGQTLSNTGITDPLTLGWELLPYSFVVDWFYPVGAYLSNLNYAQGLEFSSGFTVVYSKDTMAWSFEDSSEQTGQWFAHVSGGSDKEDHVRVLRQPMAYFPRLPAPQLKDPFTPTHVANALSLLATAFSSSGRKVR